jgi:hypothetical protein
MSAAKWRRIGELLSTEPLALWLFEVTGDLEGMKVARRWCSQRGYDVRFLVGEGGSQRVEGGKASYDNGVIIALRRKSAVFREYRRLEERVLGVQVALRGVTKPLHLAGMHGLHGQRASSFSKQLTAAGEWLQKRGGGLLSADANRIPCIAWRPGAATLDVGDKLLRTACGWSCSCCPEGLPSTVRGEIVGGAGMASIEWTRRDERGTSRLDWHMAVGDEAGRWTAHRAAFQRTEDDASDMSDHALTGVTTTRVEGVPSGRDARPPPALPLRGETARRVKARYRWTVRDSEKAHDLRARAEAALAKGARRPVRGAWR